MLNKAPRFETAIKPIFKIDLITGLDGVLEDGSIVVYNSPKAIDPENNKMIIDFEFGRKNFIRAKKNDDNSFSCKINKTLLPKKSEKYKIGIQLSDENGAKALP